MFKSKESCNCQSQVPIWMEEALRMGLHGPMNRVPAPGQSGAAHPAAAQPARAPVAWIAPHQREAAQMVLLSLPSVPWSLMHPSLYVASVVTITNQLLMRCFVS